MKDESANLRHAIEAIDAITDYTTDGEAAFSSPRSAALPVTG